MKLALVNIILVIVLFASCKKEPKYYYFKDQRIRDALNIKQGSYFIYKDSVNGELDTAIITRYSNYFVTKHDNGDNQFEYIAIGQENYMTDKYSFGATALPVAYDHINASIGFDSPQVEMLELPFVKGKTYIPYNGVVVIYVNYYPSFTLNNNFYEDVYEVTTSYTKEQFHFHSYFSLKSGLIKYTIQKENSYGSYELIDSKIIR